MLAALFLGISRCVSADMCPDDAALIAAVRRRDDAFVAAASAQLAEENPNNVTSFYGERIKGVSHVICGEALPATLPMVTCKFTIRYSSRTAIRLPGW